MHFSPFSSMWCAIPRPKVGCLTVCSRLNAQFFDWDDDIGVCCVELVAHVLGVTAELLINNQINNLKIILY